MTSPDSGMRTYVLTLDAVRWAIDDLSRRPIHPFFLAYLHLRARSVAEGRTSGIRPQWNDLGQYLEVPGGPPRKPYYRPMWHHSVTDSTRYWLNENLAGSYAPSSLRNEPRKVIDTAGQTFLLKPDHARLALQHLLYEQRVSAFTMAVFLFRDFGIKEMSRQPRAALLVDIFRDTFGFLEGQSSDDDFDTLFHDAIPSNYAKPFEEWTEDLAGVTN